MGSVKNEKSVRIMINVIHGWRAIKQEQGKQQVFWLVE